MPNSGVVAFLDAQLEPLGQRDRELHFDDAVGQLARQLESRALEDSEHRPVLVQHLGDEALDPDACGTRSQPLQEPCPILSPAPSPRLQRGLGQGRVAQAHIVADRDDPLSVLVRERSQEGTSLGPVRIEQRLHELRSQVREAVEAAVEALARERAVEVEQRLAVGCRRRPQSERPAVAEDHIDRVTCCCRHGSIRAALPHLSPWNDNERVAVTRSLSGCRE